MARLDLVVEDAAGAADDARHRLALGMANDLRAMAHVRVDLATAPAAPGGKSSAALEVGRLIVTGAFSASTVAAIASVLRVWLVQRKVGAIKLRRGDVELVVQGGTDAQVKAVLDRLQEVLGDTGSEE